jgi:hypothetical protein
MADSIVNLGPTKGIANVVIPEQGPRVLACQLNFADTPTIEVFSLLSTFMGNIEYVQGAYIDNSDNPNQLHLLISSTQQRITIPGRAQGYVSILFTQVPDLTVETVQADVNVYFHFYNVPIQGSIWLTNDAAPGGAGLTDAELRATPVPVSGPLTDTELRATPVPVIASNTGAAYTDQSIAALSGATETLMAANANRKILIIVNPSLATIWVNLVGDPAVASGAGSIPILPNGSLIIDNSAPTSEITVIGTVGDVVTAYEG